MCTIINGKEIAIQMDKEFIDRINQCPIQPGLAVLLVGDRPDSHTYVSMKRKRCSKLGIYSRLIKLDATVNNRILIEHIDNLNNDPKIHGILVQLPLPKHINEEYVLSKIKIKKDVDGFHYENMGRLTMGRNPLFVPCTPEGCIELLDRYNISIEGKHAVILGRSNIVGLPLALMLLRRNATITICHSRTQNIEKKVKEADILIAACGIPQFVQEEWLKQGVVIIDVGINKIDDTSRKRGYRLVGDVDFDNAKGKASYITPVPGGVGPMTISMLMKHTIDSAYYYSLSSSTMDIVE
tara:strand:+ start:300 stop:1187 length:888 start_codon:yes stop_codon:yes gene_type:complete